MKFSTLLLASASIAALSAAPAFARTAPGIHAASRHATLVKTHPTRITLMNVTSTATFTGTISTASDYKVKTEILGDTWYDTTSGGLCIFPPKEKWTLLPKKTAYARIGQSTMTGTLSVCPSGSQTPTYHEILYTLETKKAVGSTDVVTGTLTASKWKLAPGVVYNLYLKATIDLSITS